MHSGLVESATWILRVYGILAVLHLVLQYRYALGHQWRLYQETERAARNRGVVVRGQGRHRQLSWYVPFLPKRLRVEREREFAALDRTVKIAPSPGSVAVWVTVYQEDVSALRACLQSLRQQTYRGRLKFYISDDGSYYAQIARYSAPPPEAGPKRRWPFSRRKVEDYAERLAYYRQKRLELEALFDEFRSDPRFEFITPTVNAGKREAQQKAWVRSHPHTEKLRETGVYGHVEYELYASVDSDTVLDPDALSRLAGNFRNPDVAAATGYVDVRNANVNLLTRLIDMRYWTAFHVERAAQSYHRAVMCCSGPLAMYRASVVDQVMWRYVTQKFLGKYCTFGDDRHLTNLILELGYLVVMDPRAHCLTDVPTTMRQYIKQQTRWNQSFYREMLWTTGAIRSHSWYMTYDLTMQFILPFCLIAALFATIVVAVTGSLFTTLGLYVLTIVGIGLVRSLYGAINRRQASFLLFALYGFIHIGVLMPVRFRSLFFLTVLRRTDWATR